MPLRDRILRDFSLIRFYVVLAITVSYFIVQLVTAHLSHSLILQIDAYHMLYNVLSLITCIITVSLCQKQNHKDGGDMKSTFGWTRLHVIGVVSNVFFLAALGFSVTVESLQSIFHVEHHDSMHRELWVGAVGIAGLIVNSICYYTIGGYTHHQSSFLHHVGNDFVISAAVEKYLEKGVKYRKRQNLGSIFRDSFGSVLVVITAAIVHFMDFSGVKYVDPLLTISTVVLLVLLSIQIGKDACHVLLLTIPDHIDVKNILKQLRESVPELYDIHDFHVWQLTPQRIIASAHIVLEQTQGYLAIQNSIVDFLHQQGISHITLQPEFLQVDTPDGSPSNPRRRKCFLPCDEECEQKQCCATVDLTPRNSFASPSLTLPISIPLSEINASNRTISNPGTSSTEDGNISDENLEPESQPMMPRS